MVTITKANGDRVEFEPRRLLRSLRNAGANPKTANEVLNKVREKLHDGMSTKKIYKLAFKELRKIDEGTASRYGTRAAVIRLGKGHQGFSFEKYMGKLFERMGYKVKTNQVIQGKSGITHEIDVVLEKGKERIMVECKHVSRAGYWINVQTPLYVYARFLDLKHHFTKAKLVTNARFSYQSEEYAKSVSLELLSWNYPKEKPLRILIDEYAVHPVTVMKTVNNDILGKLLSRDIVTVTEIFQYPSKDLAGLLGDKNAARVRQEAEKIIRDHKHI